MSGESMIMTNEEMDALIRFITDTQAQTRQCILSTIQRVNELGESRSQMREQMRAGWRDNDARTYGPDVRQRMDTDQQRTREAINRLNISNEVTRNLAKEVEKELAISTS